jgi:hypothetical protein
MATRTSATLHPYAGDDTNFRNNAQFIEDTLVTTGGWVVTSDTGQTTPASLAHPTLANTKKGYRIYRMADSLQGSYPVYMRIDYGSGLNDASVFGIWFTIGTSTDGAGTITGVLATVTQVCSGSSSSSISQVCNCYGSAATGRASVGMFIQATNVAYVLVFTIERSKDSNGADTGDGLLLAWTGASASNALDFTRYLICAGGSQPPAESGVISVLSRANPQQIYSSATGFAIIFHFKGPAQQPGLNVGVLNSSDVGAESTVSASVYGSTRTYQHLNNFQPAFVAGSPDTTRRILLRYD